MTNCKNNYHYCVAFFSTLVIATGLMITSFFMPPKGVIHPSVLQAAAEMFLWPTLAFGVKAIGEWKRSKDTEIHAVDKKTE